MSAKTQQQRLGGYFPITSKEILSTLSDEELEVNDVVSQLQWLEFGLFDRIDIVSELTDNPLLDKLSPIQRDRFANNLSNFAAELTELCKAIHEGIAEEYI
jgi:hypothetical protein